MTDTGMDDNIDIDIDNDIHFSPDVDCEDDEVIVGKEKSGYRVIMYNKLEVERLEKITIKQMLIADSLSKVPVVHSDAFLIKAMALYPEVFKETELKKKRGKKSTSYFIEDVGKYLWVKWNLSKLATDRNNFVSYCYTLIDGVIFKYQRHKHGLAYEEIFQSAVVKVIHAMSKFDPDRIVGKDDKGNNIYARIFTYFTMVLSFGICTITMAYGAEKITNVSYDAISRTMNSDTDGFTDAAVIYQDFLLTLGSILHDPYEQFEDITEMDRLVLEKLVLLLNKPASHAGLVHNLEYTLKVETGLKQKDIASCLIKLRSHFGPLQFTTQKSTLSDSEIDNGNQD